MVIDDGCAEGFEWLLWSANDLRHRDGFQQFWVQLCMVELSHLDP